MYLETANGCARYFHISAIQKVEARGRNCESAIFLKIELHSYILEEKQTCIGLL